jgi:hypothetical protein
MAHMAKLDENNIVVAVLVARDEDEDREAELLARTGDTYKRTSYNTRGGKHYQADGTESADQSKAFRKNYAGIGYTYDAGRDAFIPPTPYASWVLDETTCNWDAPIALPSDSGTEDADGNIISYTWDEDAYQADNTAGWVRTEIPA